MARLGRSQPFKPLVQPFRIVNTEVTKTQSAISRISVTATKTQPAIARIAVVSTKVQTATASVIPVNTVDKTQPAIARIANSPTKTQPAIARIQQSVTKTQGSIARVANVVTKTQGATATITVRNYSRTSTNTLPTTNAILATQFSASEITDVATVNSVFVDLIGSNTYNIFQFADYNATQQDITLSWTGKSTKATTTTTAYLQIYNFNTPGWETIDTDAATAANTSFTLTGTQSTNLSNYYDSGKRVWGRVYQ